MNYKVLTGQYNEQNSKFGNDLPLLFIKRKSFN